MPIGPNELKKVTEKEQETIDQACEIIDSKLRERFDGKEIYISMNILPTLSQKEREAIVEAYLKENWKTVRFDSDRDGSFIYLGV